MSPQTAPPVSEVAAERGAVIDQLRAAVQALNELDADLQRGNVLAARERSTVLRGELVDLARLLGLT